MSETVFTGTATTVVQEFTYTETQNKLKIVNDSVTPININVPGSREGVGFFNITINALQTWENEVDFTAFTIFTDNGTADFTATVTNDYADNADIETQINNLAQEVENLDVSDLDATNFSPTFLNDLNGGTIPPNDTVTPEKTTFIERIESSNLVNPSELSAGGNYIYEGVITSTGDTNFHATGFFEIENGRSYSSNGGSQYYSLFDGSQIYVEQGLDRQFTATYGGYARWTIYADDNYISENLMIIEGEYTDLEMIDLYEPYYVRHALKDIESIVDELPQEVKSEYSKKTLIAVGDSITECLGANPLSTTFPYLLTSKLGFDTLYRCCQAGARYEDFAGIITHSAGIENGLPNAATFASGDTILMFLGQNDIDTPIGDINDAPAIDPNSLYASVKYCVEYILNLNKLADLIMFSPSMSWQSNGDTNYAELRIVADVIEDVAQLYKLPFIDILETCGFNLINREDIMSSPTDLVHPSYTDGHYSLYQTMRRGVAY